MNRFTLVVDQFGDHLSLKNECVLVTNEKLKTHKQIPIESISNLLIKRPQFRISGSLINACFDRNIPITMLNQKRKVLTLEPGLSPKYLPLRMKQYQLNHSSWAAESAIHLIASKIKSQCYHLRELKRKGSNPPQLLDSLSQCIHTLNTLYHAVLTLPDRDPSLLNPKLLALEGQAAQHYWTLIKEVLPDEFDFKGRHKPKASDLFNVTLNWTYTYFSQILTSCLIQHGLDPASGFFHTLQPKRYSLTWDLIEPWRGIIDRWTVSILLNSRPHLSSSLTQNHQLSDKVKHKLKHALLKKLSAPLSTSISPHSRSPLDLIHSDCQNLVHAYQTQTQWKSALFDL